MSDILREYLQAFLFVCWDVCHEVKFLSDVRFLSSFWVYVSGYEASDLFVGVCPTLTAL